MFHTVKTDVGGNSTATIYIGWTRNTEANIFLKVAMCFTLFSLLVPATFYMQTFVLVKVLIPSMFLEIYLLSYLTLEKANYPFESM